MLLQWDKDTDEIVKQIKSQKSFLKIILKTFNDGFFLEKWIKHHANIVGLENLVIADNMSTDEDVLAAYEKYSNVLVFQFSGYHNDIHNITKYKDLYAAIKSSCQYMLFIDTDELLVLFDESGWYADNRILDQIIASHNNQNDYIIITIALHNALYSDRYFFIDIFDGISWGKPLFPCNYIVHEIFMHNIQVPWYRFKKPVNLNLFLLHLDKLSKEQRIKANKYKLIKRGLCTIDDDVNSILQKDWKNWKDPTAIRFVYEIQFLQNQPAQHEYKEIPMGHLELSSNGSIAFANADEPSTLENFLKDLELHIDTILYPETAIEIFNQAMILLKAGDIMIAKSIFNQGMIKYPNYLDQYGHPAFRKELMRTLLSEKQWYEATKLIPNQGDLGGEYWHEILFARAYTAINDVENAKLWWLKIIQREPLNEQAKKFFNKI